MITTAFISFFTLPRFQVQNKDEWLAVVKRAKAQNDGIARDIDFQEVELHGNVTKTTGRIQVKRRSTEHYWVRYVARLPISERSLANVPGKRNL